MCSCVEECSCVQFSLLLVYTFLCVVDLYARSATSIYLILMYLKLLLLQHTIPCTHTDTIHARTVHTYSLLYVDSLPNSIGLYAYYFSLDFVPVCVHARKRVTLRIRCWLIFNIQWLCVYLLVCTTVRT